MILQTPINRDSLPVLSAIPVKSPALQLIDAIAECGIKPPSEIIFDGTIHRFVSDNKSSNNQSGWYIAHDGKFAAFGCWKLSVISKWRLDIGRSYTHVENMQFNQRIAEARAIAEKERLENYENAAEKAKQILIESTAASDSHPYLLVKGIKAHGARINGEGHLVIPVCADGHNDVISLQTIAPNGDKRFLYQGQMKGGWWHIGDLHDAKHVCIAEGFATAASIYEETNLPVAIAFNAGNLKSTSQSVRELVGSQCTITICADLDESKVGEVKANEASTAIGARVVVSPTSSDFNDAAQAGVNISELIKIANNDFLIDAETMMLNRETTRWLIKHWIPRNSLIMLHGASGSGKSLIVMDMVCRIASNIDEWEGHKVRHGSVVYLAGEGYIGMAKRMLAWKAHTQLQDKINMHISKHGCDLNTPSGYQLARESIISTKNKPSLIVVDTLHRFMSGDENSAQDAGEMIKYCGYLQNEFECSVLLVHHTGVADGAQSRARGSSAWKGAMESEISIVPQVDDMPLEIHNIKAKDDAPASVKYMRIKSHVFDGSDGIEMWQDEDGDFVKGGYVCTSDKVEKDSKITQTDKNELSEIVKQFGKKLENGKPWVSDLAWSDAMVDENGVKTPVLRNKKYKMKKRMVEAFLIEEFENGYVCNFSMSFL